MPDRTPWPWAPLRHRAAWSLIRRPPSTRRMPGCVTRGAEGRRRRGPSTSPARVGTSPCPHRDRVHPTPDFRSCDRDVTTATSSTLWRARAGPRRWPGTCSVSSGSGLTSGRHGGQAPPCRRAAPAFLAGSARTPTARGSWSVRDPRDGSELADIALPVRRPLRRIHWPFPCARRSARDDDLLRLGQRYPSALRMTCSIGRHRLDRDSSSLDNGCSPRVIASIPSSRRPCRHSVLGAPAAHAVPLLFKPLRRCSTSRPRPGR